MLDRIEIDDSGGPEDPIFVVVSGKFKGIQFCYLDAKISDDDKLAFAFDFRNNSAEKFLAFTNEDNFDILVKEFTDLIGNNLSNMMVKEQHASETA